MNEVLSDSGTTTVCSEVETCFIDLRTVHNVYVKSIVGGRNNNWPERCGRKLTNGTPITHNDGYDIYDSVVVAHEYIQVSNQLLPALEFKLTDPRGNVVPLHGRNVSVSLVCATTKED